MRRLLLSAIMLVAATTYAQDKTRMFVSTEVNTSQITYKSVFKQDLGDIATFTNKVIYGTKGDYDLHFKRLDVTTSLDFKFSKKRHTFSMGHSRQENITTKEIVNMVFYKLEIKLF